MCLLTDWNHAEQALGNKITCYKTVSLNSDGRDAYLTSLFYGFEYELGETYTEKDFPMRLTGWTVNTAFHAYMLEGTAISSVCDKDREVMLECEIPEGSYYYISTGKGEICSNRIKVLRWKFAFEEEWRTEMPTLEMVAPEWYRNNRDNWIDSLRKLKKSYGKSK